MLNPGTRTSLGRVRFLGAAGEGTGHFWRQRLTALANRFLVLAFLAILVSLSGAGYEETVATLGNPFVAIVILLAVLNISIHMRLVMQVIIEDYVHSEIPKFALLIGNWLFSWAVALTAAFAVLKIALGA